MLRLLNDTLHVSIDRITNQDKIGPRLRKEVCFRYPYRKQGNDYHVDFITSNAFHEMTHKSLDDYLISFEYVGCELMESLGMRPHLYEGVVQFEQVVKRAKSSIASLLRETTGKNDLKFIDKFHELPKRVYFGAYTAETLVSLGYSGSHLYSTFTKWGTDNEGVNSSYDPDGRLLLRQEEDIHPEYVDEAGNVQPDGHARILEQLHLSDNMFLQQNNPQGLANVSNLTMNVRRNMYQVNVSRNQRDTVASKKKFNAAKNYLTQIGLVVEDDHEIPPVPDALSMLDAGLPTILPAYSGSTFQVTSILDPEVTQASVEELLEREANLPFLRSDYLDSFWSLLLIRMKELHDPELANQENYYPIHQRAWEIINHETPFYQVQRVNVRITELARWLRIKIGRGRRSTYMIALEFAHVYRISDIHPYEPPNDWVPVNANQIPDHNLLSVI